MSAAVRQRQQKTAALAQKENEFRDLILRAYKATAFGGTAGTQPQDGFFHGARNGRLVVIGPINLPVGRLFVEEVITECRKRGATRADVLAFEFEMGLFPAVLEEARGKGIDLTPKYIPAEVFDKRAVDKGQVVFHDISFVEATPRLDKKDKLALSDRADRLLGLLHPGRRRGRDRRHERRQERGHVRARPTLQGEQEQGRHRQEGAA